MKPNINHVSKAPCDCLSRLRADKLVAYGRDWRAIMVGLCCPELLNMPNRRYTTEY